MYFLSFSFTLTSHLKHNEDSLILSIYTQWECVTLQLWACILVQVTMYHRLRIGRDGHLDQSKAYDIS